MLAHGGTLGALAEAGIVIVLALGIGWISWRERVRRETKRRERDGDTG